MTAANFDRQSSIEYPCDSAYLYTPRGRRLRFIYLNSTLIPPIPSTMSQPYEIRNNDTGRSKKQSMAELKLRRLNELNQRLQEDLNRRRIPVSEASME